VILGALARLGCVHFCVALVVGSRVLAVSPSVSANERNPGEHGQQFTFYVVPHAHMDLEWMWTNERGRAFAIEILRHALAMLEQDPRYAFTQDQKEALEAFWNSLSKKEQATLKRFVSDGRFEVATGMVDQPDVNEPDFESLTRQLLAGKPWAERTFGANVVTAWNVDTFGQTIQMPQLYGKAGLRYAFFSRDYPPALANAIKNLFYWRSPDGSTVLAHMGNYALGFELRPERTLGIDLRPTGLKYLHELIRHNPAGNDKIMIPWGVDEYLPTENSDQLEKIVRESAAKLGIAVKAVVITTATGYFQAVERSGVRLPTYSYDFNPPLLYGDIRGVWGQRPRQKQTERRVEDELEGAERLASIASSYGDRYPANELSWGWGRVLANQIHDTMAGSDSDPVNDIAASRYSGALEAARQAQADSLFQISRMIGTGSGGPYPLVVFNTLSFKRTEVVRCFQTFQQEAYLSNRQLTNFRVVDPRGHVVPFRVLGVSHISGFATDTTDSATADALGTSSALTMAELEFLAEDVPGMGYQVYQLEAAPGNPVEAAWQPLVGEVTTPFFSLSLDPKSGSLRELIDRRTGKSLLAPGKYAGNEIVLEEERSPGMEGALHFTGSEIRSSQFPVESISKREDELGVTLRIRGPFLGGERTQQIQLYRAIPRVDFKTELRGFPGHDGMVTVAFPLELESGSKSLYETHGAVVQRPRGIYPASTWMELADQRGGIAIINRSTGGYEVKENVVQLLLFRSITRYDAYQAASAAERGDHVFEYSLYPHDGDWSRSDVIEQAHGFNSPLRVISTDAHTGSLPEEFAFVKVSQGDFEVTALKQAQDGAGFVLRGHETHGKAGRVKLHFDVPVQSARFASLTEVPGEEIPVQGDQVQFDAKPFEYVTLRISFLTREDMQ